MPAFSMVILLDVLMEVITCADIGKSQIMTYLSTLVVCKWTK